MKKPIFLLLLLAASFSAFSQSTPTTISYNKKEQSALMIELPYTQEITEGFLISSMEKTGYTPEKGSGLFGKNSKVNGYYHFKGVRLKGYDSALDLYFKVVQKSKLNKGASIIFMIIAKGEEQFIHQSDDAAAYGAAQAFMNGFDAQSAAYKLHLDVQDEEAGVQDAEAKLLRLKEDETALQQKIEQLQTQLRLNREHQEAQGKAIEHGKLKLATLKSGAGR